MTQLCKPRCINPTGIFRLFRLCTFQTYSDKSIRRPSDTDVCCCTRCLGFGCNCAQTLIQFSARLPFASEVFNWNYLIQNMKTVLSYRGFYILQWYTWIISKTTHIYKISKSELLLRDKDWGFAFTSTPCPACSRQSIRASNDQEGGLRLRNEYFNLFDLPWPLLMVERRSRIGNSFVAPWLQRKVCFHISSTLTIGTRKTKPKPNGATLLQSNCKAILPSFTEVNSSCQGIQARPGQRINLLKLNCMVWCCLNDFISTLIVETAKLSIK